MALALLRRKAGDEAGALAAVGIARQHLAKRRADGEKHWLLDLAEAELATFGHDRGSAFKALESA